MCQDQEHHFRHPAFGQPAGGACPAERVFHPSSRPPPHPKSGQFDRGFQACRELDTRLPSKVQLEVITLYSAHQRRRICFEPRMFLSTLKT